MYGTLWCIKGCQSLLMYQTDIQLSVYVQELDNPYLPSYDDKTLLRSLIHDGLLGHRGLQCKLCNDGCICVLSNGKCFESCFRLG